MQNSGNRKIKARKIRSPLLKFGALFVLFTGPFFIGILLKKIDTTIFLIVVAATIVSIFLIYEAKTKLVKVMWIFLGASIYSLMLLATFGSYLGANKINDRISLIWLIVSGILFVFGIILAYAVVFTEAD